MNKIENVNENEMLITVQGDINVALMDLVADVNVEEWLEVEAKSEQEVVFKAMHSVPLSTRLESPVSEFDFNMMMGQIAYVVAIINKLGLSINDIVWNLDSVYVCPTTREMKFMYLPTLEDKEDNSYEKLIKDVVYACKPVCAQDTFLTEFVYSFKKENINATKLFAYVINKDTKVAELLRMAQPLPYELKMEIPVMEEIPEYIEEEREIPVFEEEPVMELPEIPVEEPIVEEEPVMELPEIPVVEEPVIEEEPVVESTEMPLETTAVDDIPVLPIVEQPQDIILPDLPIMQEVENMSQGISFDEPTENEFEEFVNGQDNQPIMPKIPSMKETTLADDSLASGFEAFKKNQGMPELPKIPVINNDQTMLMTDNGDKTMVMEDEGDKTMVMEDEGDLTMVMDEEPLKPAIPQCILTRVSTNERVVIDRNEFTLGKSKYVDGFTVIGNSAVSREHARIIRKGEKFYIIDLNSSNYSFVNHNRIQPNKEIVLFNNDLITLGNEDFKVEIIK